MPCIVIDNPEWDKEWSPGWGGPERIEFDVYNPSDREETRQYLITQETPFGVTYNVETCRNGDDLNIKYSWKNNKHLSRKYGIKFRKDDFTWGTHILRNVISGKKNGSSIWYGEPGPGWRMEEVVGERRKVTTTKIQRAQARFRSMLLAEDGCCAVTEETCHDVLEAAHIVPVKNGGQEVLTNGILLRADLHRLYDTNPPKFEICPETGQVLTVGNFNYRGFDLNERQLDEAICRRISDALHRRQRRDG